MKKYKQKRAQDPPTVRRVQDLVLSFGTEKKTIVQPSPSVFCVSTRVESPMNKDANVWILIVVFEDGPSLGGVFSTQEKAQEFVAKTADALELDELRYELHARPIDAHLTCDCYSMIYRKTHTAGTGELH